MRLRLFVQPLYSVRARMPRPWKWIDCSMLKLRREVFQLITQS